MGPAAVDMFQKNVDEFFHGIANIFGIIDDILIAGFDELGRDHDEIRQDAKKMLTG